MYIVSNHILHVNYSTNWYNPRAYIIIIDHEMMVKVIQQIHPRIPNSSRSCKLSWVAKVNLKTHIHIHKNLEYIIGSDLWAWVRLMIETLLSHHLLLDIDGLQTYTACTVTTSFLDNIGLIFIIRLDVDNIYHISTTWP